MRPNTKRAPLCGSDSMKLGLTGHNRSCNRAYCGASAAFGGRHAFFPAHWRTSRGQENSFHHLKAAGDEKNLSSTAGASVHTSGARGLRLLHRRMGVVHRERDPRQEFESERRSGNRQRSRPTFAGVSAYPEHIRNSHGLARP